MVDDKNDLFRVDLKKEPLDKDVPQFTIAVGPKDKDSKDGRGVIKLMWEKTQYSTEFTVQK